jgi:D-apiose dehydrogenase
MMLRFAMLGAGFWARYQLAAWGEMEGVQCVAICDPVREKAESLARARNVPAVYTEAEALLEQEKPDFIDIVTSPETHHDLVLLAAKHRIPVICQKPMANSLADAEAMVAACREAGIPFFVHENWRWQRPLREMKAVLDSGVLGIVYRAHIAFRTGMPILENQPYLAELEEYILPDMGTHILDVARFYFGEAQSLYCQCHRVHPHIKGEDAATVMMKMNGVTVVCDMAEAETPLEHDRGDTFVFVEGEKGSAELTADCWLRVTTKEGTQARRVPPRSYDWAHPDYMLFQSAMVACHANLLAGLRGEGVAETTGEDNIKTIRLVYAGYDSARNGRVIHFEENRAG